MATIEQILGAASEVRDSAKEDARDSNDHAERAAAYAVASAFDRFIDNLEYAEREAAQAVLNRAQAA